MLALQNAEVGQMGSRHIAGADQTGCLQNFVFAVPFPQNSAKFAVQKNRSALVAAQKNHFDSYFAEFVAAPFAAAKSAAAVTAAATSAVVSTADFALQRDPVLQTQQNNCSGFGELAPARRY